MQYYSPKQINGRLKHLGFDDVGSIESIYQFIYQDKHQKGTQQLYLRCQKTYRKRYHKEQDRRGKIANRVDISHRPAIIEQRPRFGDWEGDTSCALLAAFDVNSITFDNGKELANHESMAKNKLVALHT